MDIVSGTVSGIKYNEALCDFNDGDKMIRYTLEFYIGRQKVRYKSLQRPMINDGDKIHIVVAHRDGYLDGLSYRNCTNGTCGNTKVQGPIIFGAIFIIGGIMLAPASDSNGLFESLSKYPPILIGIIFLATGLQVFRRRWMLSKCRC